MGGSNSPYPISEHVSAARISDLTFFFGGGGYFPQLLSSGESAIKSPSEQRHPSNNIKYDRRDVL